MGGPDGQCTKICGRDEIAAEGIQMGLQIEMNESGVSNLGYFHVDLVPVGYMWATSGGGF